jgi:hypothetical protein
VINQEIEAKVELAQNEVQIQRDSVRNAELALEEAENLPADDPEKERRMRISLQLLDEQKLKLDKAKGAV